MDSQNKYSKWVMTVGTVENEILPERVELIGLLRSISSKWQFQEEKGASRHYQCCFQTDIRQRKSTILNNIAKSKLNKDNTNTFIAMFTISPMQGSWEQAVSYCSKDDTRIGETYSSETKYSRKDIQSLDELETRFPWQQQIITELLDKTEDYFKDPDDRTIIWITDKQGCSGKSKLVKWFASNFNDVCKISFGSSSQIRSALISIGSKKCYFVDIPRTLGNDEDIDAVISALEDLKNGYLVSVFYGRYNSLIFDPPHVVVFSNMDCPKTKMSRDRWKEYSIYNLGFMDERNNPHNY